MVLRAIASLRQMGLSAEQAAELSTSRIRIPMEGQLESLNAAVAAAILMYEVHRQRR